MAAKVAVALRLAAEKLERVDAYAVSRGVSRQVVLESAVDSFLVDVERGVPDLVKPEPVPLSQREADAAERKRIEDAAYAEMKAAHGARQQRLNEDKERRLAS